MVRTRLPLLSAIALIVAMIFNCGVAVAGPIQTSADYLMPGCRDAGICVPAGTTSQQVTGIVVQYIDGQPARIHEDFNRFAVEALRANWPCSLEAVARDPLTAALH